jgi:hypothetical protein
MANAIFLNWKTHFGLPEHLKNTYWKGWGVSLSYVLRVLEL